MRGGRPGDYQSRGQNAVHHIADQFDLSFIVGAHAPPARAADIARQVFMARQVQTVFSRGEVAYAAVTPALDPWSE